jgi:N-ethylmaleimide reductase
MGIVRRGWIMAHEALFTELVIEDYVVKNRIALAPLTRGRAGGTRVPNSIMATYYKQRSGAGILISEATVISKQGIGWVGSPGIYTDAMEEGWRMVNDELAGTGTQFFLQLWHCGRASHSDFHKGELPVSASAVKLEGDQIHTPLGKKDFEVPRPLEKDEIARIVNDYKVAAERAKRAGFAGVEVHSANGYLLNQFLDTKSNKRTDEYGGSIPNRFRFLKEILDAVLTVFPSHRVAVRLSPNGVFNDMGCPDYRELYDYVIGELDKLDLGYLHVMDGLAFGFHELGAPYTLDDVRKIYKGDIMGNCGYTPEGAAKAVSEGKADLISLGRPFITNPDLPARIKAGHPLEPSEDMSLWYGGGHEGYTDYPKWKG